VSTKWENTRFWPVFYKLTWMSKYRPCSKISVRSMRTVILKPHFQKQELSQAAEYRMVSSR
ncbi:hypothetical protein NDU88_003350, partial [Pleurodeles waltl]